MAAAPQGGGSQPSDGSTGILWIIAAIFLAIGTIWIVFKPQILWAYFQFKLWEVDVLSFIMGSLNIHRFDADFERIHWVLVSFLHADSKALKFDDLIILGNQVGEYVKFPFAAIVGLLAIVVYQGNSVRVFKRIYSMKDLAQLEQVNWPQIIPVTRLELLKESIDKGPWAMAMTPMQFCKRHQLLQEYRRTGEALTLKDRNRIEVSLKRGLANKIFAIQLGNLWQGTDKLPPYARALFAVFAARINADSAAAAKLLSDISFSSSGKLNFSGADALLKKHEQTKLVQKVVQSHAYVLTVMAAMLEAARDDGVQASADFLWLKPVDRRLWYMLNTVGRQTPFVEVAGPFAHWMAEKEGVKRLLVPMVEEATNALELALKDIIYQPDEA